MKEAFCFLLMLPSMGEWSHNFYMMSETISIFLSAGVFIISFDLLQERVIITLLLWLHRSHRGNLYHCGLWLYWQYTLNVQSLLSLACWLFFFLALWFVNFFLTFFKASTRYRYLHCVSCGIFAHWFSLNQMFKFSVSFATEVEKTDHRKDVLTEVFARQKT